MMMNGFLEDANCKLKKDFTHITETYAIHSPSFKSLHHPQRKIISVLLRLTTYQDKNIYISIYISLSRVRLQTQVIVKHTLEKNMTATLTLPLIPQ
jgi:hypothetical protein